MSRLFDRRAFLAYTVAATATRLRAEPADEPPDYRAFRDQVIAIGRRYFPAPPFAPIGDGGIDWGLHRLYVLNIYRETRLLPAEAREPAIVHWLAAFSPTTTAEMNAVEKSSSDWAAARRVLRPVLLRFPFPAVAWPPIHRPFSNDLVLGYALDTEHSLIYVSERHARPWCKSLDEVHATAMSNLEAVGPVPIEVEAEENGKPMLLRVCRGDSYDSSRILMPGLRRRIAELLDGPALAAIPSRDMFVAWSPAYSHRDDAVQMVHDAVEAAPRPLSDEIFFLSETGVRPATAEELRL